MLAMGYGSKNKGWKEHRSIPIPYPELLMSFIRWIKVLSFWRSKTYGITFILHQVEFAQLEHTKYIPVLARASTKGVVTKLDEPVTFW